MERSGYLAFHAHKTMMLLWKSNLELVTYTFQQQQHIIIIINIEYTVNELP